MRKGQGQITYKIVGAEHEQHARIALGMLMTLNFDEIPPTGYAVRTTQDRLLSFWLRRTKTMIVCEVGYPDAPADTSSDLLPIPRGA